MKTISHEEVQQVTGGADNGESIVIVGGPWPEPVPPPPHRWIDPLIGNLP